MTFQEAQLHDVSIKSNRLTIREWTNDEIDLGHMYKLESIPEVVRYQEWEPRSRAEAADVVRVILEGQKRSPRTHVELAVFKSCDGSPFLGRIGCNISLDTVPIRANLWFAFMPNFHGKGYATEALNLFIALLQSSGVKRMDIECDPRNKGSSHLAERLGFNKIKETANAWESKGEWVGSLEYRKDFD